MKYVAFLRAINVGGHASVRMNDLRDEFAAAGCRGVHTYIQSGNVVFEVAEAAAAPTFKKIRAKLRHLLGAEPEIVFRTARQIKAIVAGAPFRRLEGRRGIKLYVAFLARKPGRKPRLPLRSEPEALETLALKGLEVFLLSRRKKSGFYGFPNNFIEKELGVPATSRNWSTVSKIGELLRDRR